jgi:hypothetical protein
MTTHLNLEEEKYIKPLKDRRIFHLLADKEAFYGEKGDVLVFLNDYKRLVIKVNTIKFLFVEEKTLHIATKTQHWVVLFNNGLNHMLNHPRLSGIIRLPLNNTLNYGKHAC